MKSVFNKKVLYIYMLIYVIVSIILSRNTMIESCIIGFEKSFLICVILAIPLYVVFLKKIIKKEISIKNFKSVGLFLFSLMVVIIIKRDWQLYNIPVLFYITTGIIVSTLIDFEKFKEHYINIMFVLAIASLLVTYIAKPILIEMNIQEELEKYNLIVTNPCEYKFLNLGLGFAMFQKDYIRNYGIFSEPSYYQFYLTVAIVIILFLKEKKKKWDWIKLSVFIVTMFTTFSAAAIVVLAILAILYLTKLVYDNRKDKRKVIMILVICLVAIMALLAIKSVRNYIVMSYNKITTVNESSTSRYGSLRFTIEKTIKSPIIGNKLSEITTYKDSITNTTFAISAIYGIIPLFYSLYFTFKFASSNKKNSTKLSLVITAIIVLSYNSHFYIGIQSFWMILLSANKLCKIGETNNENSLDS